MGQAMRKHAATVVRRQGSVSTNTLNAAWPTAARIRLNLTALGLSPGTYGPVLQMYNKLFQQGVSANQANAMLTTLPARTRTTTAQSAQKLLSNKYGIATSDLQKMKDTTAVRTSNTSGEMGGFDSALSQATTTCRSSTRCLARS